MRNAACICSASLNRFRGLSSTAFRTNVTSSGWARRLSLSAAETADMEPLTHGEMDVLRLVAQGDDNRTIAERLVLSERTIANRLSIIYQKLQVNNRTQAALFALRRGWAELEEE